MYTPKKRNDAPRKRRLSTRGGMPKSGYSYAPMSTLGGSKMNKSPLGMGYDRMYNHSTMEYSPEDYSPLDNEISPLESFMCSNDMFVPGILDDEEDW